MSFLALLNILYSLHFDNFSNINSYTATLFLSLITGFIFFKIGKNFKDDITAYEQIFLVLLVYFLISFFYSIPFYFADYNLSFIDSYFESVSGLSGTGFSVFENISNLDPPLILWRSSSQWIGGFYFLIFIILIFSNKLIGFKFVDFSFNLEKKLNFSSNWLSVSIRTFFIYFFLTILIFSLFSISGIRFFNSFNLAMTVISSGGFLPTNSLDRIITTNLQSIFLSLSFLVSLLNFYLIYNIFFNRSDLKNHKEDSYLVILIIIFSMVFYFIHELDLLSVFVNILSSIGTSGISLGEVQGNFALYLLILTLLGGSVLSTTSGIKFIRIYILIKALFAEMYKLVKPNVIISSNIAFSEKKINTENIKMSFLIFILFFLSLFILSSILLVDTLNFENSFKLSILTLTNTATSNIYGIEQIQFANLFTFSKISLIIFMVIAKVELLTIFILARKLFFKD
ncbi:MAG: TrkH family potassium uptake protein [Pelagibacteraceae bacterium]|nr:TrkH family potassium uptake protein [Pelagibacteraceae bacterium]